MEIIDYILPQAQLWILFLLRTLGFVFVVPIFSANTAPIQFRIALGFFLTVISFAAWSPLVTPASTEMQAFIPAALGEVVLGLMLGFLVGLVFVVFQFAGQFIGYQMGFAIVNVLDPQSQSQVSLIGEFMFALVMLLFLQLNMHHQYLQLWYQTYDIAPPGAWAFENFNLAVLTKSFDDLFYLSLKIALPLISFLLLTDLALGIIARVMPQMNVFIVGIPLKIAMGLFFLSLVVLQFDPVVRETTYTFVNNTGLFLKNLVT